MYPCHPRPLCDHRRPCWQRSGRSAWRPPSPCPWARPQPPTRHSQACHSAPGHALCAAITAVPSCTIAELFVPLGTSPCCRRRRQQAQRDQAVARQPPRGFAAPAASASARLAPGKGTEDAPWTPRHLRPSGQELARHKAHGAHLASSSFALPSSMPLRSRLDPLDRE